jgi:hypothetical protein
MMSEAIHEPSDVARSAPTIYPPSPPIEELLDRFWETGPDFEKVEVRIAPPDAPLEILKQLGPSPFERGGFPLIGFLASTYDRISQYTLERK